MARWSAPIKLTDYTSFRDYLSWSGCYEIGYLRGGWFTAKYVGKTDNLYRRAADYMNPARCHNEHILAKLYSERHNLYFRVIRTSGHHGMEARLQARHGVGSQGAYAWNKRTEWSYLTA